MTNYAEIALILGVTVGMPAVICYFFLKKQKRDEYYGKKYAERQRIDRIGEEAYIEELGRERARRELRRRR